MWSVQTSFPQGGCKQRVSLECVLSAAMHRWEKGSLFVVLSVVGRIAATTREQRVTASPGLDEARNATRGGLAQGEKYGIAEQAVTVAPVETPCTSGESAREE